MFSLTAAMDEEKPIEEWIKEWFPVEFDHVFISYLPDRDLEGKLFGGATSYAARGSYRRSDGDVITEGTKLVTSFVKEIDLTAEALKSITDCLKEFGRATNQENVAFVLDGRMHWIPI
ncbi:hypothetical protein L0244_08750 [bacterium]|nr:hypothetical protein [bacterium]